MKELAKSYKRSMHNAKKRFTYKLQQKLRQVRQTSAKEYWDILKKPVQNKDQHSSVPLQTLMEHFKKLSFDAKESSQNQTDPPSAASSSGIYDLINAPFEEKEIADQIKRLKTTNLAGLMAFVMSF